MSMRWPGARWSSSDLRMNSRGGTRCRMALTVVSTMVGLLARRRAPAAPAAAMRRATISRVRADAIVGHRVPGREGDDAHLRREEREPLGRAPPAAGRRARHAAARPGRHRARARTLGRELRQDARVEPFRHAGISISFGNRPIQCRRVRLMPCTRSILHSSPWNSAQFRRSGQRTRRPARISGRRIHSCRSGSGSRQQPLEQRQLARAPSRQAVLGKAPEQPVHLLGAAVRRAIGGAPAARFDVVGHEARL